ncbi:tetratricopeptide repeat protein [Marinobacter gelidimuriae]|uniref:tetratricopeptide repeat protein n=1 Tax=Marinobacter gelidimuriae TaxID=2739064 RepID=UPI0003812B5F|nr:hypothetical protein [Marinobacter gelidimuriae]
MQAETELGMTKPAIAPTGSAEEATGGSLLDRLLGMAHRYRSEGNMRQAMEMYWALLENHPETAQALVAHATLLKLAEAHERDGARHAARYMYERLL